MPRRDRRRRAAGVTAGAAIWRLVLPPRLST
ncbi:hypothetical protein SCE1572_18385 [Sorangium cellulosum So0157-2]|uniref:Uncharacterized protein n=1 Tax=Sorangium cellulosum So0157-2 TaxID=1254432 RepID=S4XUT0_SORCE|nr:hypothetical protein SCE1572_18385 [Sorangium cellulosum So0157-2]